MMMPRHEAIGQPEISYGKTRVFPGLHVHPGCGMVTILQPRDESRTSSRDGAEGSVPKGPGPS